ncbi:hypothetical protein BLJ79_21505 [Arthrobacter sp. UCD-GKA]|uniref:replicative DNA helicase n=1 Tax=Arthrobacter sp. UCD-GKA TaxID=1913576 RepID=UPI0008DE4011|nr:DnaB-like helicase C-terminal domain-containing protein [Arthrobacter sp. UCD-GKA]OIH81939.1 hypothetical protein BLJ79_21505 [Arthrobacter sp. UCD-GKA]
MIDLDTAELSVLGSLLLTSGRILEELDFAPTDYRQPAYEFIHRTVQDMKNAGKAIDQLTVMDSVMKSGERIDPLILHKAMEVTPTASNAQLYAGIVTDAATMRRLGVAAERVKQMIDGGGDADEIMEASRKEIDGAQSSTKSQPVQFVADTMEATVNYLESPIAFTPTPWPSLNQIIDGLKPGALYVIGARPSVGKSVVGLQLARGLAEHGSVAFMSLEMSVHDVNVRLMAADLKIDMRRLMRNELTPGDWNKIGPWMQDRGNMPLAVNDNTGASIADIKRFVRNVHRRKPLAGVVVDYLQLMSQQPGDKRARHEFVADMSRQLKVMAMELGVPVIALSQLNRGSTARDDQRPKISDLRESGAVEQDADAVILLHREIDTDKKGEIDMLVGKNRNGPTGSTSMQFSGHYASIQDYS